MSTDDFADVRALYPAVMVQFKEWIPGACAESDLEALEAELGQQLDHFIVCMPEEYVPHAHILTELKWNWAARHLARARIHHLEQLLAELQDPL